MPLVCASALVFPSVSRLRGFHRENVWKDPSTWKPPRKCPFVMTDRSLFENTIACVNYTSSIISIPKRFLLFFISPEILDLRQKNFFLNLRLTKLTRQIGRISYKNVNQFNKCTSKLILTLLWLSHFYESDPCDNALCDLDKIVSYNSI